MEYGLSVFGHHDVEKPPDENFRTVVEQVRTARDVGFDYIIAGHHYVMEERQKFQVMPAMSRLAADAGEMRVGMFLLLPLHHPVEIAEQYATLDAITGGRTIFAPVMGYRDKEFEAFGISKRDQRGRFVESIEVIKRLWTEDSVSYDGEHFAFEDVTITPKPMQDPRPPIWIGANRDAAVKTASEIGDAWFVNPHDTEEVLAEQLAMIDEPQGEGYHGLQPMAKPAFVAPTDEEALRIYGPQLEAFFEWYEKVGQGEAMETPEAIDLSETGLDRFLIGSPETVARKIVRLESELGIDSLTVSMHKIGIDTADVQRSIELFGEEVVPRVEERLSSG